MGRQVRRVPMDFNHPLNKTWTGFLNPHYVKCLDCNGTGSTMAAHRLEDLVGLLMLSGTDARRENCHLYFDNMPLHYSQGKVCGKEMSELTIGLAGRKPSSWGHDACDRWSAVKKIKDAAGVPESWGRCPNCKGKGIPVDNHDAYEKWEPTEPPTGEGWQMWETVSEGSPISPVFATPEGLALHMEGTRWGADEGTPYETWLKFIKGSGWAPSLMTGTDGNLVSGVEGVTSLHQEFRPVKKYGNTP